jgi:two-component system cell cycle sensor histidine kinase PleC
MTSLARTKTAQKIKPVQAVRSTRSGTALRPQEDRTPRLVIQDNGRIIYASTGLAALLKSKAPSFQGSLAQDLITFIDPDDAQRDRPGLGGADGDPWTSSIMSGEHAVIVSHNGAEAPLSLQFDWIALPDGRRYLVASGVPPVNRSKSKTDLKDLVTALVHKKQTSRKAPQSGESFSDALPVFATMTHDLMMLMERDGQLISGNQTFMDTLSYDTNDLAGLNFLDLVHPDDRPHIRSQFKSLMQDDDADDGRMIAFDCRVLSKDQSIHWLEWRQKRQGGKIFAVARNLTEIRAHESALIRHQQQLSEAQEIGRMGHWRWHVGNDAIVWSDQIYRIFGRTRESFQPSLHSVNAVLHRRDRGRMAQAFQRAMIEQRDYDMEFRIIRPDGQIRFILLQGRCELDGDGDVTSLFGIMQDITERTQHERELREAKDSAERAYAAKSQFLANMSHELRTPLNAIIGFSEMMQRQLLGPIGTEKYLDYIGGIRESGEHLLDLISDILDMSRIEAGKYELDLEEFNLLKILRLGAHMIEGRALDAQVRVLSSIPEDGSLNVIADRRAVMQMILNLLSNAVKFTKPGGEVRIEYTRNESCVTFRITDTGIGIPASKLKYVTRPFEQVANHFTRNHEGSGLGLSITKDLAELHGGNLQIESEIGTGTSVTITLPWDASKARKPRSLSKRVR